MHATVLPGWTRPATAAPSPNTRLRPTNGFPRCSTGQCRRDTGAGPVGGSWLNQIEIWFSILADQSLAGASFTSVAQLRANIDAFVATYNEHAKPFAWTKSKVRQKRLKARFADQ
jgi:hypothetical protein